MTSRKNRKFTADQKAEAVRRHLWDKVPVSDLAADLGVPPSQIHNWINQAKQQIEKLFDRPAGSFGKAP